MVAAMTRCPCKLSLRASEGPAAAAPGARGAPGHTALHGRIKKAKASPGGGIAAAAGVDPVLRAIPGGAGTGHAARSEWLRHRHKTRGGLTGFTPPASRDTREMPAHTVTGGRGGGTRRSKGLPDHGPKNAGAGTGGRRGAVGRGCPPMPEIEA